MQLFLAALAGLLVQIAPYLVTRLLLAFGIGLVSFATLGALWTQMSGYLETSFTSLSTVTAISALFDHSGLYVVIRTILSALAARVAIDSLTVGMKKL